MRALYYDFSLSDQFVVHGTRNNDPLIIFEFLLGMFASGSKQPAFDEVNRSTDFSSSRRRAACYSKRGLPSCAHR
jgi:hypothetical protein